MRPVFKKLSSKNHFLLISTLIILLILVVAILWQTNQLTAIIQNLSETELTIRWTTESELDVIGFNLYRSDTPDGEFVKINQELIPPAADPFLGGEHKFVETNVIRGQVYYYQLETIDRYGNARREGPYAIPAGK